MKTKITELLGIKYPIFQGGMAHVSDASLAAAVSNAGGLGIIACAWNDPKWVISEVKKIKELTDKPYAINFPAFSPFKAQYVDIAIEEKVPAITMGAGKPDQELMNKCKNAGIKIISVVPNIKAALGCVKSGVDAVIIEGTESGGHIGDLTTMVLMTECIPKISVPVVAAGGFADGRGLAAALIMGADGIQIGTRFMTAKECLMHENAKKAVLQAEGTDIDVTGSNRKKIGAVRGIKNAFSTKYHEMEDSGVSKEELVKFTAGTNRRAAVEGDVENGFVLAGQIVGAVTKEQTCKEIIDEIMADAEKLLKNAPELLK